MSVERCTTHFHACDCREAATKDEIATLRQQLDEARKQINDLGCQLSASSTARLQMESERDAAIRKLNECEDCAKNLPTVGQERDRLKAALDKISYQLISAQKEPSIIPSIQDIIDTALKGGKDAN